MIKDKFIILIIITSLFQIQTEVQAWQTLETQCSWFEERFNHSSCRHEYRQSGIPIATEIDKCQLIDGYHIKTVTCVPGGRVIFRYYQDAACTVVGSPPMIVYQQDDCHKRQDGSDIYVRVRDIKQYGHGYYPEQNEKINKFAPYFSVNLQDQEVPFDCYNESSRTTFQYYYLPSIIKYNQSDTSVLTYTSTSRFTPNFVQWDPAHNKFTFWGLKQAYLGTYTLGIRVEAAYDSNMFNQYYFNLIIKDTTPYLVHPSEETMPWPWMVHVITNVKTETYHNSNGTTNNTLYANSTHNAVGYQFFQQVNMQYQHNMSVNVVQSRAY